MIVLNNQEIITCFEFANDAWNKCSQSVRQFGTIKERNKESFIADQITGKLAELIFKKQIESEFKKISIEVDFQHYLDPLHTDEGDVTINIDGDVISLRFDIKGSSHRAQWLLVEEHKFRNLKTKVPMADRYVMVKFSSDMPTSEYLRNNPTEILNLQQVSGEIAGWAKHSDFITQQDKLPWFTFNKGDRLISAQVLPQSSSKVNDLRHLENYINKVQISKKLDTHYIGPRLDASVNVGLPIKWLSNDLEKLVNI